MRRDAQGARRVASGFAVALCAALAACSGTPIRENEAGAAAPAQPTGGPPAKRSGGYYLDDGPGANPPADLASVPDAMPRLEPIKASTARPYTALGKSYTPNSEIVPYKARGVASWYGRRYHGQRTSSGEVYDMYAMTAAHPTLAIPSYVRVTSVQNGRSVVVRVNDRGPFHSDRLIDLSYVAAWKLGIIGDGSGTVEVEAILPGATEASASSASATQAVVAPAQDPIAAPAPASGVFLQLGAFGNRDNAEDFLGKMRVELGDLGVTPQIVLLGSLYRVQAGPYADRAAAASDAVRISDRLGVKPLVVVR